MRTEFKYQLLLKQGCRSRLVLTPRRDLLGFSVSHDYTLQRNLILLRVRSEEINPLLSPVVLPISSHLTRLFLSSSSSFLTV